MPQEPASPRAGDPGDWRVPGARRAAPRARGVTPPADLGYHGPVFMDSDIYKTLEAIGWELESPAPGVARQRGPAGRPGPGAGPPDGTRRRVRRLRRDDHRAARPRPAAGRLPELLRPGQRRAPLPEPRHQPRDVLRRPPLPGRDRPGQGRRQPGRDGHRGQAGRPPGQGVRGPAQGHWTATPSSRRPWSSCTARRAPPPTATWPPSSSSSAATAWRATPASAAATCKITSRSGSGPPRSATRSAPSTWRRA